MRNYIMELYYVPLANHSGKCSYFLLRVFFKSTCMANLIKGYRFSIVLYKSKFYYALHGHYTPNYKECITLFFTALEVII